MSTIQWRVLLVAFFAVCLGGTIYNYTAHNRGGSADAGFICVATSKPFVCTAHVQDGSEAYRAGLRDGDIIDYRSQSFAERIAIKVATPVGASRHVVVERDGRRADLRWVVPPEPWAPWWPLGVLSDALMLLATGILCWRGASTPQGRVLAAYLLFAVLPFSNAPGQFATLNPYVTSVMTTLAACLSTALPLCFMLYLGMFGQRSRLRTALAAVNYAVILAFPAVIFLRYFGIETLWFDIGNLWFEQNTLLTIFRIAFDTLPLAYAGVTLASMPASERSRVAWITTAYALSSLPDVAFIVLFYANAGNTLLTQVLQFISNLGASAIIVYGVLNRRVLDIGFALNRAAVFATVSAVVVGGFVLVEWGANELFSEQSRNNAAFSAVIALGLGLSTRFIHARVDRFIDVVFFRKRHSDEAALQRFARQALYISSIPTLLDRTRAVLREHAGAKRVEVWLDDGSQLQADADDPALVALRAGEPYVMIRDAASALSGDIAYPLPAAGRIIGALVLETEEAEHSFAPDEISAVEAIAHNVGVALDALRERNKDNGLQPLVDEMHAMRALLTQMTARTPELESP